MNQDSEEVVPIVSKPHTLTLQINSSSNRNHYGSDKHILNVPQHMLDDTIRSDAVVKYNSQSNLLLDNSETRSNK